MSALKLNVVQARLSVMRNNLAQQFRQQQLVRQHWCLWLARCEEHEESKLVVPTHRAYQHYRHIVLNKMWLQWQHYVEWRRHRKDQYVKADAHFIVTTMPPCLTALYEHAQLSKYKRELQQMGDQFQRMNIQSKYFYTWSQALETSQDQRMMERMAILHYDEAVLRRYHKVWRQKTQLAQEEEFKMSVAMEHHEVQLCRRALNLWKQHTQGCRQSYHNQRLAARHWYLNKVGQAWTAWRQYLAERRGRSHLKAVANSHYQKNVLSKMLSGWKQHHRWWTEVLAFTQAKCNYSNQNLLRRSLHIWYHNVQLQKMQQQRDALAQHHFECQVKSKVLQTWHRYAVVHAHKKAKTHQQVVLGMQVINKVCLQHAFNKWKEARDTALVDRRKWEQARAHHDSCLKRQGLAAWTRFTAHNIRKQLMLRQCIRLHNVRLSRWAFSAWKMTFQQALVTQGKTNLALWHWSQNLQRNVILGWYVYAQERKRKASRISDALEIRRRRLLREGATKWLAVATDLAQMRQRFAAQRGAERAHQVYQVVQRCASHWRSVTARRKADRGGGPPRPCSQPNPSPCAHVNLPSKVFPKSDAGVLFPPKPSSSSPARLGSKNKVATAVVTGTVVKHSRPSPRTPAFLIESLKREGLYSSSEKVESRGGYSFMLDQEVKPAPGYDVAALPSQGLSPVVPAPRDNQLVQPQDGTVSGTGSRTSSLLQSSSQFLPVISEMESTPCDPTGQVTHDLAGHGAHDIRSLVMQDIAGHVTLPTTSEGKRTSGPQDAMVTEHYCLPLKTRDSQHDVGREPATKSSTLSKTVDFQLKPKMLDDSDITPRLLLHPVRPTEMVSTRDDREMNHVILSDIEESEVPKENDSYLKRLVVPEFSRNVNKVQQCGVSVELLPPSAFLTKKDGTSLLDFQTHVDKCDIEKMPSNSSAGTLARGDFDSPVTPVVPHIGSVPGYQAHDLLGGGDTGADVEAMFLSPAEEMVNIRNRMLVFQENKSKLRQLEEQQVQLSSWLKDQPEGSTEPDVLEVASELAQLKEELQSLTAQVRMEKPQMQKLAQRVKQLIPSLSAGGTNN